MSPCLGGVFSSWFVWVGLGWVGFFVVYLGPSCITSIRRQRRWHRSRAELCAGACYIEILLTNIFGIREQNLVCVVSLQD